MRRRLIFANVIALFVLVAALVGTERPATARAIEEIREQIQYVERILPDARHNYLVALAVNSYVVGHVSATAYGYLHEIADRPLPTGPDMAALAEAALRTGAGICGQAAAVAMTLYDALGVESRLLQIYYVLPDGTTAGHTTTEVFYGGAWHWFDPTWGIFYRDDKVDSLVEVLEMTPAHRKAAYVGDDSKLWTQVVRISGVIGTGLEFLNYPRLKVESAGRLLYERGVEELGVH
jgi:hypothetical protein